LRDAHWPRYDGRMKPQRVPRPNSLAESRARLLGSPIPSTIPAKVLSLPGPDAVVPVETAGDAARERVASPTAQKLLASNAEILHRIDMLERTVQRQSALIERMFARFDPEHVVAAIESVDGDGDEGDLIASGSADEAAPVEAAPVEAQPEQLGGESA
jgi:hypothetical protein